MTDHPPESRPPPRPRRGLPRSLLLGVATGVLSLAVLLAVMFAQNLPPSWPDVAVDAAACVAFGVVLGWVTWATRKRSAAVAVTAAVLAGVVTPVLLVMSIEFIETWATGGGSRGNLAGHNGPPVPPMSFQAAGNACNNAVLMAMFIGVFLTPLGGVVGAAAGVAGRFRRTRNTSG